MILGLTGKAGSGKSTLANAIASKTDVKLLKFATPLKNMLRSILRDYEYNETDIEQIIEGDRKNEQLKFGKSYRQCIITLGTEWGRDLINEDIWAKWGEEKIKNNIGANLIFDDVRFQNEVDIIKKYGGTIIRVTSNSQYDEIKHISEALEYYDETIYNDKTKDINIIAEEILRRNNEI